MGFNSVSIIHSCPGLGTLALLAIAHLLANGNAGWERSKFCSQLNIVFVEYTDKILLGDTCVWCRTARWDLAAGKWLVIGSASPAAGLALNRSGEAAVVQ